MILYILSGAPGSGKTTYSKKIANEQNAIRLSFDELHCFQHKELIPYIMETLKKNKNVVVDAVFYSITQRKMILEATKNFNCKRILVYMNTSLEECIHRNAQRSHPLPDFMVEGIYNSMQLPTLDEGWDEILYF
jgi:tRNA uridine 5-carbamoylmethylation protein Kti12